MSLLPYVKVYRVKSYSFLKWLNKCIVHVEMYINCPVTYWDTVMPCLLECAYIYQTGLMEVLNTQFMKNTEPNGRGLMQVCRVVPQTKHENCCMRYHK